MPASFRLSSARRYRVARALALVAAGAWAFASPVHSTTVAGLQSPAAGAASQAAPPTPAEIARTWIGADGTPLPFKTDAEVLEFLRTADVTRAQDIGVGVTHPYKLTLEKGGVTVHAKFSHVDESKAIGTLAGGKREVGFRDYYGYETAAYHVGLLLGLDNVPPAVNRQYRNQDGSVQLWVEGVMTEDGRKKGQIEPPDVDRWNQQMRMMRLFDNLVYNVDRNAGNILIDKSWKLWMIDHTRAFRLSEDLNDAKAVVGCERRVWERLQSFNDADARARLKPYLGGPIINALLKRRAKLVDVIRKLIAQQGEASVIFSVN